MSRNIKRGDTWPPLTLRVTDGIPVGDPPEPGPMDLTTAAEVRVIIKTEDGPGIALGPATVTDAAEGKVTYDWQPGDTDDAGKYDAEVEILWSSGGIQTVPSAGYDEININVDLGGISGGDGP